MHDKKSQEGLGNSDGQAVSFDWKQNITEATQRWTLDGWKTLDGQVRQD